MNRISQVSGKTNRVAQRLSMAEGYLELGLPQLAIEELDTVDDPGNLEPIWHSMYGEALRADGNYRGAMVHLAHAAQMLGPVRGQQAWTALAECHRKLGDLETAYNLEGTVQSAETMVAMKNKAMKLLSNLSTKGVIKELKPIRIVINTKQQTNE